MTIKEKLNQYIDACALVRETQSELSRLRDQAASIDSDVVRASNPEYPYQPISVKVEGHAAGTYQIERKEKILAERIEKLNGLKLEVEELLNNAPPSVARIMRIKYIKGKSWSETAKELGEGYEVEAIRKKTRRYLNGIK